VRLQTCEKVMGWCTARCKMLPFCAKTIMKESCNFELARLKKKKKKERKTFLAVWQLFGLVLSQCFSCHWACCLT